MHYIIEAEYKDRAGRRTGSDLPLWKGEAPDSASALGCAHESLHERLPFPEGTERILLTIRDDAGGEMMATEYVEDFEIGYGASAVGYTGLHNDGVTPDLTEEQVAQAERRALDRALGALDEGMRGRLAARTLEQDALVPKGPQTYKGFFDGCEAHAPEVKSEPWMDEVIDFPPLESDHVQAVNGGKVSAADITMREIADAARGLRDKCFPRFFPGTFVSSPQDERQRMRWKEYPLVDPFTLDISSGEASTPGLDIRELIEVLRFDHVEITGKEPRYVTMTREQHGRLIDEMMRDQMCGAIGSDVEYIHGMRVVVSN